jgi:hypothetical protein
LRRVVEISPTTQATDRAKSAIYAPAGVAARRLIDLTARRVEVRSEPLADGRYARLDTYAEDEQVPVPGTDATLAVRDLLG